MEKELTFSYDEEGDVLEISIGAAQKAVSKEVGDDVIARLDPSTKKIVGFTILNFSKRVEGQSGKSEIHVPIEATFKLLKAQEKA